MAIFNSININSKTFLIISMLVLISPLDILAGDAFTGKEIRLSMRQCVELTIKNNRELLMEGITPRIRTTQITQEESVFDPILSLEASKGVTENRGPSSLAGANVIRQENVIANIGIDKKISTGATLEVDFTNKEFRSNSRFASINPYYESHLLFRLTQPLLENRGSEINEAQITIAINNKNISILNLKQKMIDILSEAQKNYWEVVFQHQYLKVKELYLKQAQDLLEIYQAKVEVGVLPKFGIEILEAESSIASRQAEVLSAQNDLEDAEDQLKNITNLVAEYNNWQFSIIPTDQPDTQIITPDEAEQIATALKCRPDYVQLQDELLNNQINFRLAENELLPNLNLIGEWGINSLGDSYGDNYDKMADGNYRDWLVGINLEIPWGNRSAESKVLEKKLIVEQTNLDIKNVEQKIAMEVREAIRQLKTDLKRIKATKIAQELEIKKLATAEEKHKLGVENYTTHDVLEYQTQLSEAKTNYLKSVIDYNKSIIDFFAKNGTILEKNGIVLENSFPNG